MSKNRAEVAQGRGSQPPRKHSTKHPYAAMEHRILDSPAYADLTFSAQALLVLLARQVTATGNNGHLQASFKWCSQRGFGSEHTLRSAIAELIAHGLIYRTRSHGANGAWARYALTWIPISKDREGLFLTGFKSDAWRDWQPSEKKSSRQKLLDQSGRKCSFTPKHPAETAGSRGAKNAAYELVASSSAETASDSDMSTQEYPQQPSPTEWGNWIPDYINRLANRGLADACPVVSIH